MQAHNLSKLNTKTKKRVGRGGKRGTYSGRGIKGQKARAGRHIRPQIRDIIKKIHKRRGYFFRSIKEKPAIVNLRDLEKKFSALGGSALGGQDLARITPKLLVEFGLVRAKGNKIPKIKILGSGKLTKKLAFEKNLLMSKKAKEYVGEN